MEMKVEKIERGGKALVFTSSAVIATKEKITNEKFASLEDRLSIIEQKLKTK